jgi:folate-binding protein YgfZ
MPGLVFWVSASIADLFAEDLLANVERPDGGKLGPVGIEAWQQQRIRSGLPLWGVDFDDRTLPQELDSARGLDFEKGCYLGQEVIARLHSRGQTPRQLRRLQGDSPTRPAVGTEVLFEERAVGTLTSVASASDGGWIGLSRLARRAFDPETRVEVVGVGTARVLG